MAIFIESETTFIWNFERTRLNMIRGKTLQHNKGKTQIDSTNLRHDNWKRLNKIEMAHPLEKVFTWTKSHRHIPLFILACSYPFISWGGGLAITPWSIKSGTSFFNLRQLFVLCPILWWNTQWSFLFQFGGIGFGRGVGSSGLGWPPQSRLLVLLIKAFRDH